MKAGLLPRGASWIPGGPPIGCPGVPPCGTNATASNATSKSELLNPPLSTELPLLVRVTLPPFCMANVPMAASPAGSR
jgi:hypothetical protein